MYQASGQIDEYKRTTDPIVVGASVLAMRYKDGILVMADTGAFYGSLARYTDLERVTQVNSSTLVAFSGEYSDWQYLNDNVIKELVNEDIMANDDIERSPDQIHSYISRVLHHYRNKGNPLYNQIVVAGVAPNAEDYDQKELYLGYSDLYGTTFKDDYVATGFGLHIALPLLRANWRPDLTFEEAKQIIEDAMRVLVYRHCKTINKFQLASIDINKNVTITEPYELTTKWSYKRFVQPQAQELPLPKIR
eukprot:UN01914